MNNSISVDLKNITASLLSSFPLVPPAAIPAMLDCILASTNSSPSSLFNSLLNEFSNVTKEITEGSEKTDSGRHYCISSYVGALCHLLKKSGTNINAFESFIWKTFVPILKLFHASHLEIFNEVSSMFFDVVAQTNSWHVVEKSLLPFLFRLVWLSMGMNYSQESAIVEWSSHLNLQASDMSTNLQSFQCSNDKLTNYLNMEPSLSQLDYLPLPVSCHILILTLDAALEYKHVINSTCSLDFANEGSVENLVRNLLWDLCDLSFQMLSQSVEHRSSAIRILLPSIFEALESNCAFDLSIRGQKHLLSRNHLLEKIWACCKRLFPLGLSERRDAYAILSLYLSSSFTNESKDGNIDGKGETFDLRGDKEFWDEIRRGLVDKENLVRKQSLHILKRILNLSEQSIPDPGLSEGRSDVKSSVTRGLTKRERWAEKEAMSLGVGKIYNVFGNSFNSQQKWGAFSLLYEMLEEYGTHLVEAAWDHQMNLLLRSSFALENQVSSSCGESHQNKMVTSEEICQWLAVLWERGFYHDNPQVRCLIMQSFLGIAWEDYESYVRSVSEEFILGPLMQGLNDPVHHKDFGLKGIYASRTIHSATNFLYRYCSCLDRGKQIKFLSGLALLSKKHSFGRPGLMCFVECIASAAQGVGQHEQVCSSTGNSLETDKADLLDLFRFIIESSKQHFNSSYRFQVCEKILDAAASVMSPVDVPVEILLHFISSLPREFIDFGGSLRMKIQKWLLMWNEEHFTSNYCRKNLELSESLAGFARNFVYCHPAEAHITYDDEDVDKWDHEARRWARVIFLVLKEEQNLDTIFTIIRDCGSNLCKEDNLSEWVPVKYFIIISSLVQELRVIQEKIAEGPGRERMMKTDTHLPIMLSCVDFVNRSTLLENISQLFLSVMDEALSFSKSSSSIFWSALVEDESILPGPVRGRLGGPSQRRLSSSATTSVLQAITSLKSVASILRWCVQFRSESHVLLDSALIFLWNFCWKVIKSPSGRSESEAEISLASYEAMAHVLKELVPAFSSSSLHLIMDKDNLSNMELENEKFLDSFVQIFLQNVNNLIGVENLVRTRRAILMNWKWICLETLLSIPNFVLQNKNGVHMRSCRFFFSDNTVTWIFNDLVDNLENAGEVSVLPILRSVRLTMELFASGRMGSVVSSCNRLTPEMMWDLVNPCWILHVSCNKRRVAPIAALLSSVLHHSVFRDESMHDFDDGPGPLKWFVKQMLEEGTRSPRTIRLTALHLTGLWLRYPTTLKHYIRELKLLTLYGSVAFDEDFEAELAENQDAKSEVSTLAQSPDPELTEEFINTELYARVCVAVLFNKLADTVLVGSIKVDQDENSLAALASGKIFLLELLHLAVDDKDLSKELYKKYSAIHRRKIRVWQMICILSRFIDQDILEKVTCSLHKALQRNNFPSVRQYIETLAIQIYLKFPFLVGKQLVQFLRDYDIRPQALSSYVFIAANVILHAAKPIQSGHLNELLPPIIPLLTSHHHTLRGFAQLLVHQILQKLLHAGDSDASVTMSLEKRCLMDLESYLMCNPDCARLRASMEGYLDAFDPNFSVTPAGVFTNRVEELEFECVSKTLMDQVITFLNDARDDLRCSMAKDAATIKNEHLQINDYTNHIVISGNAGQEPEDVTLDFQKKFTLCKHELQTASGIFTDKKESFRSFTDIDKEDQLLDQLLQSRSLAVQKLRESRQHFILVASLIDRIPNLAGLARTCEVFRAAGLAIADKNILSDKQFQLISVTADKWVPITEVPVSTMKVFLQKMKREGFAILGLEQTANSIPLDQYAFPRKTVLVLGREKEGIPVEIIHILDACVEIPQLGIVRSLNVHVSGAIALWEYTRQQRSH